MGLLSKHKIILAIYVGTQFMTESVAKMLLQKVSELTENFPRSVYGIVIPEVNTNAIRVECLNPVLLTEEQYKKVDTIIETAENKLKEVYYG